jgi:hypothetical protein
MVVMGRYRQQQSLVFGSITEDAFAPHCGVGVRSTASFVTSNITVRQFCQCDDKYVLRKRAAAAAC